MFLPLDPQVTTQLPLALDWHQHGIFAQLILGLIIGAIAKALMPGKDPGGCVITSIIGIIGAGIGGLIGKYVFNTDSVGWILAIVGAMVLLFIYRLVVGKKAP